jgi:drug/metabolite transporter (DMT)-like permease
MKLKDSFHLYAAITILFWSLAYTLTRLAFSYFSPFSFGFLRYLAASLPLLPMVFTFKLKLPGLGDLKWFLLSGASGFFLYIIAFNKGCVTVTSATSSVIIATTPVVTALLARLIYKEQLRLFQWAAIAIEFSGVVFMTLCNGAFTINAGILWLLLGVVLLSGYNLLQKFLTKKYSALQTTAYSIFAGSLMLGIFAPEALSDVKRAPPVAFVYIAVLGVFSSAIAYVAWTQAFAKAPKTSSVSNYMFITPFLSSVLGYVLAGERPDRATLIGGSVILAGVFIFNFGGRLFSQVKEQSPV